MKNAEFNPYNGKDLGKGPLEWEEVGLIKNAWDCKFDLDSLKMRCEELSKEITYTEK